MKPKISFSMMMVTRIWYKARWRTQWQGWDIYETSRNSYRRWTTDSGEKRSGNSKGDRREAKGVWREIDEALNAQVEDVNVMDLDI